MQTPHVFLAYAPRGAGLRCAVAYLGSLRDAYGWFTVLRPDATPASRYFLFEDFYAQTPRYDSVDAAQLHSAWALDEARRHELAALRPNWTFYSPGFQRTVLRHLAKRWPLDYQPEVD